MPVYIHLRSFAGIAGEFSYAARRFVPCCWSSLAGEERDK